MKTTIDGKRYNSDKCEALTRITHHNNGNYSGTSILMLASDGTYLVHTISNGQDIYLSGNFRGCACSEIDDFIERAYITDSEEPRLFELGLIEIID